MTKLDQALAFLRSGISVIPLRHRSKEPASELMGGTWEKYKTEHPTEYAVKNWLATGWNNYGVVCGWSNLAVIDFDTADAFATWVNWYIAQDAPMPYLVQTARGAHAYVRLHEDGANEKRRGVDVKRHGYVVGPGSVHPSGTQYVAMGDFALIDVFSLDTVLPIDLFPKIVSSPSCGHLGALQVGLSSADDVLKSQNNTTEYDPWQAAMWESDADLISKVKSRVRIEQLFPDAHSTGGGFLAARCPFHDDQRPSFWINTKKQVCGCQVCGMRPMDVINLYGRMRGLSDSDAVRALAQEVRVWG